MNKRTKQLALEADEYCRDYVPNWTMDHYNLKFAELIVKECCQSVERKYKYSKGTPVSFGHRTLVKKISAVKY